MMNGRFMRPQKAVRGCITYSRLHGKCPLGAERTATVPSAYGHRVCVPGDTPPVSTESTEFPLITAVRFPNLSKCVKVKRLIKIYECANNATFKANFVKILGYILYGTLQRSPRLKAVTSL